MQTTNIIRNTTVIICLGCFVTGCASLTDNSSKNKGKKKEGWSWFKKKEYQEPKSMAVTWTEDTLVVPGKPITRGFGGRIYFYNEKSQAIPVDGELMVYGFEDTADGPKRGTWPSDVDLAKDAKKFKFTAEQFTQHFSESQMGASYSVWIPWDAVGGEQKKVTLCPMFVSKSQRVTRGESSQLTLSGKKSATMLAKQGTGGDDLEQAVRNNLVQLASASIPTVQPGSLPQISASPLQARSSTPFNSQMRTTTIRMDQPINGGASSGTSATAAMLAANPQAMQLLQALQNQAGNLPVQPPAMQSQVVGATAVVPLQNSNPAMNSGMSGFANTLPPLGHSAPPTGWVQPGSAQLAAPAPLVGSLPNQFPAPGLPIAR